MHKAVLLLCACSLWVGYVHSSAIHAEKQHLKTLAISNFNFTRALYGKLSRGEGNVFFSPLSIQMILALASMGARGATLTQLNRGLSLPANQEVTREGFQKLAASLKRNDNTIVKIANKIFTDTEFGPKAEFVQTAQKYFHSEASAVDFHGDTEGTRQKINRWVEDHTAQKIKDLFPEGSLSSDTLMVLANAVYFKANWATEFNASETTTQPFYVTETETKDVPMMYLKGEFFHKNCKVLNAQVLELPYVDHKMGLVIILPNERTGLAALEQKLSEMPLSDVTKHLRLPEVEVWLPKFKMEQSVELSDVLEEMGMTDMFSSAANFSGITDQNVYVDKVIHKAFIEVNEEGAEAAAATGISFQPRMAGRSFDPLVLRADHPFILLLRHKFKSNPVLFMGRYSQP